MIVIQERDQAIKEFLIEVGISDTKTLHTLFFTNTSMRNAQKRLSQLVSIRFIKAYRENVISQNVYYVRQKPKNIAHKIIFSRLLGELKRQDIEVLKYKCPYKISDVISDGLIVIRIKNQVKIYFCEGEISKKLDIAKYEQLFYSSAYKEKFPVMPSILCITDKKQETEHEVLDIKTCKLDFSDFKGDLLYF